VPTDVSKLKVAIVHDWLISARGGERMLEGLLELFPQADIFTLFHRKGRTSAAIEAHTIHASFLNHLPGVERYHRYLLPLMPYAAERLRLDGYDLVVSSSHCVAKGVLPGPGALHVSYCHTTMRYAWDQSFEYFGDGFTHWLLSPILHYLRMWDVSSSARVDHFIANSRFVARRIETYYRRTADIVNPFVDLDRFTLHDGKRGDYYLVVSAFAPYKRVDLAIEACQRLGRRLVVVGDGQDAGRLRRLGGKTTEFLGNRPDSELPALYAGARALLFPGVEDFGITPLEAMASGTPVIAYGIGGVLDTVLDGKTGLFFRKQTVSGMVAAIQEFESLPAAFSPQACRDHAEGFSKARFQREFLRIVHQKLREKAPVDFGRSTGGGLPTEPGGLHHA
jgi:glycosyltransferase involved in cell wall biosynthesis